MPIEYIIVKSACSDFSTGRNKDHSLEDFQSEISKLLVLGFNLVGGVTCIQSVESRYGYYVQALAK
jgi:hypothetical protein